MFFKPTYNIEVSQCNIFNLCFSLPTDADNEMITFSSDEELVEALGSFNGDVFRVYVKADDQDATFDGGYCVD